MRTYRPTAESCVRACAPTGSEPWLRIAFALAHLFEAFNLTSPSHCAWHGSEKRKIEKKKIEKVNDPFEPIASFQSHYEKIQTQKLKKFK